MGLIQAIPYPPGRHGGCLEQRPREPLRVPLSLLDPTEGDSCGLWAPQAGLPQAGRQRVAKWLWGCFL